MFSFAPLLNALKQILGFVVALLPLKKKKKEFCCISIVKCINSSLLEKPKINNKQKTKTNFDFLFYYY